MALDCGLVICTHSARHVASILFCQYPSSFITHPWTSKAKLKTQRVARTHTLTLVTDPSTRYLHTHTRVAHYLH